MTATLKRFNRDQAGATAIEYGLIALFIAVALITAVTLTGTKVISVFAKISTALGG